VFASLGEDPGRWAVVLVGLGAMASAILISLQTFLDYSSRAARHHVAAANFKELIHRLEEPAGNDSLISSAWIAEIRQRMDDYEASGPVVGWRLYNEVEREYSDPELKASMFN
jgi:hypothetical protein